MSIKGQEEFAYNIFISVYFWMIDLPHCFCGTTKIFVSFNFSGQNRLCGEVFRQEKYEMQCDIGRRIT